MLSRAAWGAPPTSPSGFQSMWRNPWPSQSRSPRSPVKLDLFPGITRSTSKKIFTEFIFTSRSPSSQGALPCPPSLQLSLHLPLAFPPCCHNTRLCERNNVYSPPRMGGLAMKSAASPSPRPRAALGGGRRRNSCRNADGHGRPEDSPDEGINIHGGGEREERKRKKGPGTGIIQGPSFFSGV